MRRPYFKWASPSSTNDVNMFSSIMTNILRFLSFIIVDYIVKIIVEMMREMKKMKNERVKAEEK